VGFLLVRDWCATPHVSATTTDLHSAGFKTLKITFLPNKNIVKTFDENKDYLWPLPKEDLTAKQPTIPVLKPTRRIDYILFAGSDDFEVLTEEVLTADNYGSNHLAFWARMRYK
jgi:hypothetical protein